MFSNRLSQLALILEKLKGTHERVQAKTFVIIFNTFFSLGKNILSTIFV